MCLGRKLDLPLSDSGICRAQSAGRFLRSKGIQAVYTSPLKRAMQTAGNIAAGDIPLLVIPELIELDGGAWDGLSFDEIHRAYPDYFNGSTLFSVPPGGESDEAGLKRAMLALEKIRSDAYDCVAAVSHSGIGRLLLAHLSGLELSQKKRIRFPYAAIVKLVFEGGTWQTVSCQWSVGSGQ